MTQRRDDMSLGSEQTFDNRVERAAMDRSLGDQSTFGGQQDSSLGPLDSGDFLANDDMEIVDLSKRYRIERVIGQGGMGQVLLATDTRLERKVAIKRILGDAARSKSALQRFLTEAKSIAALSHPNIVQIYDYGRAADGPFLIMEFVDGVSLLDRSRQGAMPWNEAVELTCQLCEGLACAHAAGIIHRDIKPANILLTKSGYPKLTDFGLAKSESADGGMTITGAVLGTLDFMPPEQRRDAALVDARSDLWSLAATLYQLVTGESPKIIRIKKVPSQLQDLLDKALEEEKESRFQTAVELRDALRKSQSSIRQISVDSVRDLNAGQCLKCGTHNDSNRKFCRECGDPLRCLCVQCQHEISVWEKVCPECGAKQLELIAERIAKLQEAREAAEQMRSKHAYQASADVAKAMATLNDPRLSAYATWGKEFLVTLEQELRQALQSGEEHLAEARKHRAAFDYDSAIRAIESIPETLRTAEASDFLGTLESERSESDRLIEEIKSRIQNREVEGLLPSVERAITLRGDRADLKNLEKRLRDLYIKLGKDRDEAFGRAATLLDEGKAREALQIVKSVKSQELTVDQINFKQRLDSLVAMETDLSVMVREAKADGVIDYREVLAILPRTIGYLKHNPRQAAICKLRDELLQKLKKFPAESIWELPPEVLRHPLPNDLIPELPLLRNSINLALRFIPVGKFQMGWAEGEDCEKPAHEVTLTRPFYLGVHQITQEQYLSVMGAQPSRFQGARNPVEQVSWNEAVEFCRRLSELPAEKAAGRVYRLPTEAEWEYACRAGCTGWYGFRDDPSKLDEYAWFAANANGSSQPVGLKQPNAWGLFDMHGNVWEWCADSYDVYRPEPAIDPDGAPHNFNRLVRGGAWATDALHCRSSLRFAEVPTTRRLDLGFRIALSIPSLAIASAEPITPTLELDLGENPIANILAEELAVTKDSHVLLQPNIPADKLKRALAAYGNGVDPAEVLLLYDNTVFGGARDGFFLTTDTLYWHNISEPPGYRPFHEIQKVDTYFGFFGGNLVVDEQKINVNIGGSTKALCELFGRILNRIVATVKESGPLGT